MLAAAITSLSAPLAPPLFQTLWAHIQRRSKAEGWLSASGKRLDPEQVEMRDVARYVIQPATRQAGRGEAPTASCSYAELISTAPQPPRWIVSHGWGEGFSDLLRCLTQHSLDRQLGDDTTYFVPDLARAADALDAPSLVDGDCALARAMSFVDGSVFVLDEQAGGRPHRTAARAAASTPRVPLIVPRRVPPCATACAGASVATQGTNARRA